jgi:hypothetical protein
MLLMGTACSFLKIDLITGILKNLADTMGLKLLCLKINVVIIWGSTWAWWFGKNNLGTPVFNISSPCTLTLYLNFNIVP